MDKIEKIKEIAEFLNLNNILIEIDKIRKHQSEDALVIFPLIGEFSAGKTTLINALMDSKNLETDPKPTTSTIYEIHFGCDKCKATILNEKNELFVVEDISKFKNKELDNAQVVTVFDTSKRVPSSVVIVDTPGLSSPFQKHRQTLVDFLPQADGILLTVDINAQLTKSLIDFVKMMKLSSKPLYTVLTHKKDKVDSEIIRSKKLIMSQLEIPMNHIVAVDSRKDDMQEIYSLFAEIQHSKNDILKKVDDVRLSEITKVLIGKLDELIKIPHSNGELESALRQQKCELEKINRKIGIIIDSVSGDVECKAKSISRKFEDTIQARLNSLVSGSSSNYDAEAVAIINNTASLLLQDFKHDVKDIIVNSIKQSVQPNDEINVSMLAELDLSALTINGLTYDLDLASMGHQYDKYIKAGVIVVAAAGAAYAAVAAGGAAAAAGETTAMTEGAAGGAVAAGAETTAVSVPTTLSVIDSATDVASIVALNKFGKTMRTKIDDVNNLNDEYGKKVGNGKKGIIDSLVGLVTEKTMSLPQRKHAIRMYVDGTLAPEFKTQMNNIVRELTDSIRISLQNQTAEIVAQKTDTLKQLQTDFNDSKTKYDEKIKKLRDYKILLLNIKS